MKYNIDHKSPLPLHLQVENMLREMVKMPEYQHGALLPGEIELCKKLGIARNTLRQATNKLENEGLLIRKKGVGTRVAEQTFTTYLNNWHSFTQEMNEQGIDFQNLEISTEWVDADSRIAAFMGILERSKILKVSRLRGSEAEPHVYFESYFHPRVGLTGNEDFSQPLYRLLEDKFATIVSLSKERISARLANSLISSKLGIEKDGLILYRERLVFDPGNRPVEFNIGYYRADKFTYAIDIKI
jgi:GntR family transcriptional regulator